MCIETYPSYINPIAGSICKPTFQQTYPSCCPRSPVNIKQSLSSIRNDHKLMLSESLLPQTNAPCHTMPPPSSQCHLLQSEVLGGRTRRTGHNRVLLVQRKIPISTRIFCMSSKLDYTVFVRINSDKSTHHCMNKDKNRQQNQSLCATVDMTTG